MTDTMTIDQIRYWLRNSDSLGTPNSYNCRQMADAIDAHLKSEVPRREEGSLTWWCAIESVEAIDGVEEIAMSWNCDDANNGEAARSEANHWINDQPSAGSFRLAKVYITPQAPAQVTDDELIAIARRVGLRESMHGVHTSIAKDLLRKFMVAVMSESSKERETFQGGVENWMKQCFIPSLYSNMTERGDRLLEEVLELLQSHGYDRQRVATLVDYVFGRPVGEPGQEVGGVMVTLAGYCWIAGLDMHAEGDRELRRITHPEVMAKIRAKQDAKNALHFDSPLPGNAAMTAQESGK